MKYAAFMSVCLLACSGIDFTKTGLSNVVLGREDGVLEVYELEEAGQLRQVGLLMCILLCLQYKYTKKLLYEYRLCVRSNSASCQRVLARKSNALIAPGSGSMAGDESSAWLVDAIATTTAFACIRTRT